MRRRDETRRHTRAPSGRRRQAASRDEAKEETRQALIAAGRAAFTAQGLDAPSLDSICERAGYTRGAFYVHFRDRADFIVAVMEATLHRFMDDVIASGHGGLDLERTVRSFTRAVEDRALPPSAVPAHQILTACARSEDVRKKYVALVEEGVARLTVAVEDGQHAGTVRRDVDARQVATILVGLVLGLQTALDVGVPFDTKAAAAGVLRLLERT
jgi:AcrR family transcriptional regulator